MPNPERTVIFARAIAAFAEKTDCMLFLCRAEDTPALQSTQNLVCEALSCIGSSDGVRAICHADDVVALSAARMPYLPLPERRAGQAVFRIVFLRHGGIPCAAVFDDTGLHPTRQSERALDACLTAALTDRQTKAAPAYPSQICRVSAKDIEMAYLSRYTAVHLPQTNGHPFAFSCGTTANDRLLSALLCAMGGEEQIRAPLHFSVAEPSEDCGDILCPLTVADLRSAPVGTYSHWTLLSLLTEYRRRNAPAIPAFPTPRDPDAAKGTPPLSYPMCAPDVLWSDYRYTGTPMLSPHADDRDPAHLARRYAAAEAEDAVLLARDLALLCAQTTQPLGTLLASVHAIPPTCRRHGFAPPQNTPLYASIRRLMSEDRQEAFSPAVEGVVLRRADGFVRIVATRDRGCRIIADANTAEAAEELFAYAKSRLLRVQAAEK